MNRLRFRYSAVVLFAASLVGSLLIGGCAGRSTRPAAVPPQDRLGQNLDVHVSNVGSGGGAPSGGLRVDIHVFAPKGQNPVTLEYSITNVFPSTPILSPILVTVTLPFSDWTMVDDEHDLTLTLPISPPIVFIGGNLTSTVASLKPGETSITFTAQIQLNKMSWEHFTYPVDVRAGTYPDSNAIAQGGSSYGAGGIIFQLRIKDNQVEASDIGWLEDNSGGPTFQIVQGTVMVNSTVIAVTAIPRHSQVTPTPGTPQPLPTAKP